MKMKNDKWPIGEQGKTMKKHEKNKEKVRNMQDYPVERKPMENEEIVREM